MKLSNYVLSKMCHSNEAAVYGITKLKPSHFEGRFRTLYSVIKTIYKMNGSVDLHVFVSQAKAQNIPEKFSNELFHYCNRFTDEWENVFKEFKEESAKNRAIKDAKQIIEDLQTKSIQEVAGQTASKAVSWISDTEKRYYSGKEVDEEPEQEGKPILTGYPIFDDGIYKHGGNQKGQMKGMICREKHGKTRSECWEDAQNLRQGHKVLYVTMEGRKSDITGNVKQVLKDEWKQYRESFFVVDGIVHIDEIESVILEAVLIEGVDKVVIDYIQLVMAEGNSENERINNATERLRHLMVKYNFHLTLLSQARKESVYTSVPKDANGNKMVPDGWKHVPDVNDAYGSMALIKAASIILVGFRPNQYEQNIIHTAMSKRVINPFKEEDPYHSFYMQTVRTRNKPEYLHKWVRFQDTDNGMDRVTWA